MPLSSARTTALRSRLDKQLGALGLEQTPGTALVIEKNGKRLYANAVGLASLETKERLTEHSSIDSGSIAKFVTGLAVAILEEDGLLKPSVPIATFLPDLPSYAERIRIHHLLHHESGLHSYFTLLYYMAGWHEHAPPSADEVYEMLCRVRTLSFEPGSQYAYSDSNYFLLARIIERVSGKRFGAFARERIFEPLGMQDTYCTDEPIPSGSQHAEGYVRYPIRLASPFTFRQAQAPSAFYPTGLRYQHVGAEGLRTSAADLVTLGRQILEPTLVNPATMSSPVLHAGRIRPDGLGYGYGVNLGSFHGHRFVGHNGAIQGHTGSFCVLPNHDLIVACLANRSDVRAWDIRDTVLTELQLLPEAGDSPLRPMRVAAHENLRSGLYISAEHAHSARITRCEGEPAVRLNESTPQPVEHHIDPTLDSESIRLWVRDQHLTMTVVPKHVDRKGLAAYEGIYRCHELDCAFAVEQTESGLRFRNVDPNHPAMDLDYEATLPDFFWSHDPHPGLSQIQFLRHAGSTSGFIYRDYDGDGREAFHFHRQADAEPKDLGLSARAP